MQCYAMLCNWLVSKTYTRDGFSASLNATVARRYAIDILDDLALNIIQLQDMVILWCKNQQNLCFDTFRQAPQTAKRELDRLDRDSNIYYMITTIYDC